MNKSRTRFTMGCAAMLMSACGATLTTSELTSARSLMAQAKNGDTATRNPAELRIAERELQAAEAAHDDAPGSDLERDRAYIADRRIRIAMTNARRAQTSERSEQQEAQYTTDLESTARTQNTEIENSQTQLTQAQSQVNAGNQQLVAAADTLRTSEAQLATEQQARAASEHKLAAAMSELGQLASVNEQQETTIITLSDGVLFTAGQVNLLPDADRRIAAIVSVLRESPARTVTVVGYTDSRGNAVANQQLSLARANAVRQRILQQLPEAQIEAQGLGEAQPVADNNSSDGRASNRRVEIIIHKISAGR